MQLRLVPAFTNGLCTRQRFCQDGEPCLWFPPLHPIGFGEEREKIRSCYGCYGGTMGAKTSGDLLDPFLRPPLVCEHPATLDSTVRLPLRKSLLLRDADGGFRMRLHRRHLTTELMEYRPPIPGKTEAIGVRQLLRQRHRFLVAYPPLVRIAQDPQRPGGMTVARHPSVHPIEQHSGAVLLGVIERYPLRKVCLCRGDRAQPA